VPMVYRFFSLSLNSVAAQKYKEAADRDPFGVSGRIWTQGRLLLFWKNEPCFLGRWKEEVGKQWSGAGVLVRADFDVSDPRGSRLRATGDGVDLVSITYGVHSRTTAVRRSVPFSCCLGFR
jgi:hypothetical protein